MKVSVIVPVHNQEHNLERCVTSLVDQTHNDIEIILVENGSTDRSLELCDEFTKRDGRVSVVHLDGAGVSLARNTGLGAAFGPLVMFCDSDDWVEPDWVRSLHDCLVGGDFDLAVGGYTRVTERPSSGPSLDRCVPDAVGASLDLADFYLLERWGLLNSPCNKIYRKDVIVGAELEFDQSLSIAEDLLFNLQYLGACSRIGLVHEITYNYRVAPGGTLSTSYVPEEWAVATRVRSEFEALLKAVPGGWERYGTEFWSVNLNILERVVHRQSGASAARNLNSVVRANNRILRSPEARHILELADWGTRNPMYVSALKSQNYLWVWLYTETTKRIRTLGSILRERRSWA